MEKKVSIILTNRNTKDYLELAVVSIYNNNMDIIQNSGEVIVMDDNSTDGSKELLDHYAGALKNFKYITHNEKERKGLMILNQEGINLAKNDIIFLGHSDMYYGKDCIKNLLKYIKPNTVVCSTRVEPPIYPDEPCRYQRDYGILASSFKEEEFNKEIERLKTNKITYGVFAPTLLYKKDWIGYDLNFLPQSREDDDMWYTMIKDKNTTFIQSWDSFVYHFSGKGSRHLNDSIGDTKEWQQSNYKNSRNFIRKWGSLPNHNKWHMPIVEKNKIKVTLCTPTFNDESRIFNFLEQHEPFFDEIIIADESTDNTLKEIERYIEKESKISDIFKPEKIKIFHKELNKDYSALRNFMNEKATNEWVFHLDSDEIFESQFLNNMRELIKQVGDKAEVIGFTRLNYLNNVLVNDIPRHLWKEDFLRRIATNGK